MRTIIEASCLDQKLTVVNEPLVASGGKHEDFIVFSFCEKWDGFEKVGVFYRDGKKSVEPYYSNVDSSNMCEIPYEVIALPGTICFGVFGVLGDVVRTSSMIRYKVENGAITSNLEPSEPTPTIWEQLLNSYANVLKEVEVSNNAQAEFIANANKSVLNCNKATDECYSAIAQLNYSASDLDGGNPSTDEVIEDENDSDGGTPF